jgi:hypothetical protein
MRVAVPVLLVLSFVGGVFDEGWHSFISFTLQEVVCTVPEGESGLGCTDGRGKMVSLKKGTYKMYYPNFSTNQNSNMVDFIIE